MSPEPWRTAAANPRRTSPVLGGRSPAGPGATLGSRGAARTARRSVMTPRRRRRAISRFFGLTVDAPPRWISRTTSTFFFGSTAEAVIAGAAREGARAGRKPAVDATSASAATMVAVLISSFCDGNPEPAAMFRWGCAAKGIANDAPTRCPT